MPILGPPASSRPARTAGDTFGVSDEVVKTRLYRARLWLWERLAADFAGPGPMPGNSFRGAS